MLQNHIGELKTKPTLKKTNLEGVSPSRLLIALLGILIFILVFGIFLVGESLKFTESEILSTQIALGSLIVLFSFILFKRIRFHVYEHVHQQKKYYEWGEVKPCTNKQLEALQLIAFSRYKDGFWTDTLESAPTETRVKHIRDCSKKLNFIPIYTQEEQIEYWVESWGMSSQKKYYNLYEDLINGMHTPQFLLDYEKFPDLKKRVLDLTEISEEYFDSCFSGNNGKPKKLIWAWDLWRAVVLSTASFECGFIDEKEAWDRMYRASEMSHYLFDDIEDFYKNLRLGHAYWCNDEKQVYNREVQIKSFLNPEKGTERLVHNATWTKPKDVELTENMKDSFKSYLEKSRKKEEGNQNKIGFK